MNQTTPQTFHVGEFVSLEKYDAELSSGRENGTSQIKSLIPSDHAPSGTLAELQPLNGNAPFLLDTDWLTKL